MQNSPVKKIKDSLTEQKQKYIHTLLNHSFEKYEDYQKCFLTLQVISQIDKMWDDLISEIRED